MKISDPNHRSFVGVGRSSKHVLAGRGSRTLLICPCRCHRVGVGTHCDARNETAKYFKFRFYFRWRLEEQRTQQEVADIFAVSAHHAMHTSQGWDTLVVHPFLPDYGLIKKSRLPTFILTNTKLMSTRQHLSLSLIKTHGFCRLSCYSPIPMLFLNLPSEAFAQIMIGFDD